MKKIAAVYLLLCLMFSVSAQHPDRCATMQADSALRAVKGLESLSDFENWLQAKIVQYKASAQYLSGGRSVITIPIIFHVIHNGDAVGSGENISQAQVNSQIDVLNEDYRKAFGTAGYNTNAVGADCEIEFCAAVVDPNGAVLAEPGIDRVNMGQSSWSQSDCDATLKPQTIWDPDRYCNVWTVNFGGSSSSLLGYAQFPSSSGLQGLNNNGGSATTDGVVIRYSACGRVGNVASPYNKGRTLTHELGHYFGLRHIWGDQNCGNDYCNDTPTSSDANYGCPTGQVTCGTTDMIDNYMDYTDDGCMDIFTNDQKTRMMTVMNASPRRKSLTSSNVCSIPFTFSYTGRVVDANTNQGIPNAKVYMDGPADYTPTTDVNGYFTIANLQQDNYTLYAGKWGYVTNSIASQAFNPSTSPVTIALQPGYYDDFIFNFGWTEAGDATTGKWTRGVPQGTTYTTGGTTYNCNPGLDVTGDYGNTCYVTGNGGGSAGDDDIDGGTTTLTSPAMDLTTYTDPVIRYYRWFYNGGGSGSPNDSLIVSLVNGGQSVDIDAIGATANANVWTYKSYRVKDYFANPGSNVSIKFRSFDATPGHLVEAGLDYFRVLDSTANSSQPPVANFGSTTKTVCAGQSVTYNDLSSNSPNSWNWTFPGGTPSTSTNQNPTVSYSSPGTYPVLLTVGNGVGNNSTTQNDYITVEGIVAQFAQDMQSICPGLTVNFTNGSSCSPATIKWSFPGGIPSTSSDPNPSVTYSTPGYYDVILIAGNTFGYDTLKQNLAVQVYSPVALNAVTVSDTDNNGVGSATVNVSGGITPYTFLWNDAQHQTTQTATGLSSGTYTISVSDGHGCSSITSVHVQNVVVNGWIDLAKSYVEVFPNPLSGNTIRIHVSEEWIGAKVELSDALGRIVVTTVADNAESSVNTFSLAKGIYILRVSNSKHTKVFRLVKK